MLSLLALIFCYSYFIEKKLITANSLHHLFTQTTIQSETKTTLKIAEVP